MARLPSKSREIRFYDFQNPSPEEWRRRSRVLAVQGHNYLTSRLVARGPPRSKARKIDISIVHRPKGRKEDSGRETFWEELPVFKLLFPARGPQQLSIRYRGDRV